MSRALRPKRDKTFKGQGLGFIPVRQAHLDLIGYMVQRTPPNFDLVAGYTMVDRYFMPLGFAMVEFTEEGSAIAHAHFGHWLHIYPKDILRQMRVFFDDVRKTGTTEMFACADESIDGSVTLIEWFKGELTGDRCPEGPIYRIDLKETRI